MYCSSQSRGAVGLGSCVLKHLLVAAYQHLVVVVRGEANGSHHLEPQVDACGGASEAPATRAGRCHCGWLPVDSAMRSTKGRVSACQNGA
jgi:hypothetical protein